MNESRFAKVVSSIHEIELLTGKLPKELALADESYKELMVELWLMHKYPENFQYDPNHVLKLLIRGQEVIVRNRTDE